jgi:hypothetical protein
VDPVRNPYQPGAGRRPPELAGRHEELNGFDVLLARCEAGAGERGRVFHGLRGVGKTVLLNEFFAKAEARGWIVAKVEAAPTKPVAPLVVQGLHRALREATGRFDASRLTRLLRVFRAFTVSVDPTGSYSFGIDLEPLTGRADSGNLSLDLSELFQELGRTAQDLGMGTLLLIDEMQDVPFDELVAINVATHDVGQGARPLPVIVVGAGLPSLPGILSEATTYAERLFEYRSVGALDKEAGAEALVRPALTLGVEWASEAVDAALEASGGYPFFVQSCGKFIWDYAKTSPITLEDAEVGIGFARREIDAGLYLARWNRATPAQRQILHAMASAGEGATVPTADIAAKLGKKRGDISVPRDQLIKKGLIYAPERGLVAFTVPGMVDFINRQPD